MTLISRIRARATYANVVATLALFIALGGSSFAAATLTRSEKKQVKKIAKKQANQRITKRAPGLSVASAANALDAANAQKLAGAGPNEFLRYGATIPSGVTISGVWAGTEFNDNGTSTSFRDAVSFPAPAPAALTNADVNFADLGSTQPSDENPACTGSVANPTAPAGQVCIYAAQLFGTPNSAEGRAIANSRLGFEVRSESTNVAFESQGEGTWAYTAP